MSGMLSPIGALKGIASYVTFSGAKKTLLVVDREVCSCQLITQRGCINSFAMSHQTGHLVEEKIPMYIRTSLNLMYNTRAAKGTTECLTSPFAAAHR